MHGFCTVFARFQGMQWALWLAKYDKGCRNYWAENYDALHKNDVNSKLLKSEWLARWALLIRGPGIRVPSNAPKSHEESQDSSWDFPFSGCLHTFAHFLHTGGMICTPNTGHTVLGVHISKIAASGGAFLWIGGRFYRKSNTDYGYIRVSTREQHEARNMPVSSFYYDGKF